MESWLWLLVGILLLAVGVYLLVGFIVQFAKLIAGLIFVVLGLQLIAVARRPHVRVR